MFLNILKPHMAGRVRMMACLYYNTMSEYKHAQFNVRYKQCNSTRFLSYRVTLNARKTRDFIRYLIIWQPYNLGPLRQCSDW